jgi:integrase/recombinase XerD
LPAVAEQAATDDQLIALWLHGRPPNTRRAYERDAARFLAFVGKPLRGVILADAQAYANSLGGLAPATQARRLNVVRSLFTFGMRVGYLRFNVASVISTPPIRDSRAERILLESDVQRMLVLEPNPRNRTLLRLLYAGGLRVSELCRLRWRDLQVRDDGSVHGQTTGQVTVFGKGGKTRAILLTPSTWQELAAVQDHASPDGPVFRSRRGGHLCETQVWRIIRAAARRAGLEADVSPHWLRHAHASHALDRGAPLHLVKETLGHASIATTSRYLHARPTDSSSRYLGV